MQDYVLWVSEYVFLGNVSVCCEILLRLDWGFLQTYRVVSQNSFPNSFWIILATETEVCKYFKADALYLNIIVLYSLIIQMRIILYTL